MGPADALARDAPLTMLVIPFSLCSARLQVFVFITPAVLSPKLAGRIVPGLYLFSFAAAIITRFAVQG